tara:strand:- start:3210 stop:3620 length:411 start_codon:yes stop_codon:yes gene_type:complete
MTHPLIRTDRSKLTIIPRLLAGAPLTALNIMHLTGAAPLRPILEGANIPLPGLNAIVAPAAGLIAGVLLLAGAFARVGALIGIGSMSVALYTHAVSDWPDEPPIALPIVVLLASAWVLYKGAGTWSIDARRQPPAR